MTTYEVIPDPSITALGNVAAYEVHSVADIYATARDIATVARATGPVTVSGTHVLAGNTLIARVRVTQPWYSVASGWVTTDSDYRTVPAT